MLQRSCFSSQLSALIYVGNIFHTKSKTWCYSYDSVLVIKYFYTTADLLRYVETTVKWFVEPCLTICSFCWSDSCLHGRLLWQFCNLKFKKHPSEQNCSTINSYSNVHRNHAFKRMRRLNMSLAWFRNFLPNFNFTESETWTDKEHYETTKNYKRSLNRTEPEKVILSSFANLILTMLRKTHISFTTWPIFLLKFILAFELW